MDLPEYKLKSNALQKRLGDFLIAAGKLSPEQLDEAIEYQCIYGGRLGTSLVELGMLDEDQLAQTLSQQLKLHYIKPDLLMNVPNTILNLVPTEIALKYRVVPYHKEKGKLFLAMEDATNLANIDELSFQLNHIIVPLAIPEIRLMLALKQHYKMDLTPRFANIESNIKRRNLAAEKLKKLETKENVVVQKEESWPLLGEEAYTDEEHEGDAYFNFETPPIELSQTSLGQQLVAATDRNDVARALVNYLGQYYQTSGLLMVRKSGFTGWLSANNGVEAVGFDELSIPLHEESIFNLVVQNKTHYMGIVSDNEQNRRLLSVFACEPPQTALVIPLLVRDRLVSILYVQDHLETLEKNFPELQNLAKKAEMALTLLILRNKILTT